MSDESALAQPNALRNTPSLSWTALRVVIVIVAIIDGDRTVVIAAVTIVTSGIVIDRAVFAVFVMVLSSVIVTMAIAFQILVSGAEPL